LEASRAAGASFSPVQLNAVRKEAGHEDLLGNGKVPMKLLSNAMSVEPTWLSPQAVDIDLACTGPCRNINASMNEELRTTSSAPVCGKPCDNGKLLKLVWFNTRSKVLR